MFALAEEFHRATKALAKAQLDAPLITAYTVMQAPSLMSAAFGLELYLKCLYVLNHATAPNRTHNLKQIFDALAPATKQKLAEYFDPSEGQDIIDDMRRRKPGSIFWALPVKFDLDYAILSSSNAFVYIRYCYERESNFREQWCGSPIINAARKLILEMHPSWKYSTARRTPADVRLAPRTLSRLARKKSSD